VKFLAIDPGPERSAYVIWTGESIYISGIVPNEDLLYGIQNRFPMCGAVVCAIEMITSYGMPVGREVFETVLWIGRYFQSWTDTNEASPLLIPRGQVKLHHCQSSKAKDSNIRQALIDRFGKPGIKKAPGTTYGLKADTWQAFALAIYVADTHQARIRGAV
jgi:hypothetical protein